MAAPRQTSTSPTGKSTRQRGAMERAPSFPPPGGPATYRDLLRFEQRLTQNAEALAKQRRKYQLFLGALVCSILLLGYKVLFQPSIYSLVHYSQLALLLIATTALVLFFATGMYSTKIARGYKFVPQANRSLRPLNMHLAANGSASSTGIFSSLTGRKTHRRQTSDTTGSSSTPSARATGEKPSLNRKDSSNHPLSELIFSSRVDPEFQKGYQEFRAEWERRKSSKAPAASARRPKLAGEPSASDFSSRAASFQQDAAVTAGGDEAERGRRGRRHHHHDATQMDSAASSPSSSRSASPSSLHSPHSRFTSSTSLSSSGGQGPKTPADESDLELADLVDDHIKGVNSGRRSSSRASSLQHYPPTPDSEDESLSTQ